MGLKSTVNISITDAGLLLQGMRELGVEIHTAIKAAPALEVTRPLRSGTELLVIPDTAVILPTVVHGVEVSELTSLANLQAGSRSPAYQPDDTKSSTFVRDPVEGSNGTAQHFAEVALLVLRIVAELRKGSRSRWWFWLRTLPTLRSFWHLGHAAWEEREAVRNFIPDAEVPYLLARSVAYRPSASAAQSFGGLDLEARDLDALVVVVNRHILRTSVRGVNQIVFPGLDLLSHCDDSGHSGARVGIREGKRDGQRVVRIVALEPVSSGKKLCIQIGRTSNLELLLNRGVSLESNHISIPMKLLRDERANGNAKRGCEEANGTITIRTSVSEVSALLSGSWESFISHRSLSWLYSCYSPLGARSDNSEGEVSIIRRLGTLFESAENVAYLQKHIEAGDPDLAAALSYQVRLIRRVHDWLASKLLSASGRRAELVDVAWRAFMQRGEAHGASRTFRALARSSLSANSATCADESERYARVVEHAHRVGRPIAFATPVHFAERCAEYLKRASLPWHKPLFVLARLNDLRGLYAEAYKSLQLAHQSKRHLRGKASYQDDPVHHVLDSVVRHFTPDVHKQVLTLNSGYDMKTASEYVEKPPVFIFGLPRSGTSLVHQLLAAYPNVQTFGESPVVEDIDVALRSAYLSVPKQKGDPGFISLPYLHLLTADGLKQARHYFFDYLRVAPTNKKMLVVKNVFDFAYVGLIRLMFPDARLVHMIRDFRDVAISMYFQDFRSINFTGQFEDIVELIQEYQQVIRHWQSRLNIQILDVSYEAFVMNELERRKVVEFIGLEWDEAIAVEERWRRVEVIKTCSFCQTRSPLYNMSVGRWRSYQHLPGLRSLLQRLALKQTADL